MGFIAEIRLVHDELPLASTIAAHRSVTIRYEYALSTDRPTAFVSLFGDEHASIEASMDEDPTVSNHMRVATFANRTIHRVVLDTDRRIVPDRCGECGSFVFTITSGERGWVVRIHFPDRESLTELRRYCRDRGISFRVTQLYDSTSSDDGTYVLTERQHEILSMAYYGGYYDVPRAMTQDDLAERLGVSDSAVSQRLRRAVAELIEASLETDRTPDVPARL
ncbi:helix-turn-helix domain-containing protein [Natrarchaeobius oligotrophus]|uniref:Winged helix-turn-helix transcriptional regulator n=1 Tax=Natrarchaeobius chitinivorans TaxID=1679083 RepID=A0A3N6PKP0_NATCH|nr:helix-turn-helix domain-containing protein [Natrarchaeobius chitinivorans]RQG99355.1 winged helix-turn-helix transcriptional regulator [Natrarchaeobius chitinivorans]